MKQHCNVKLEVRFIMNLDMRNSANLTYTLEMRSFMVLCPLSKNVRHFAVHARENILHGFRWIPWRIFRVEYWNELPWTISSFSTADRRIIFLDIVHGVFPWIPWNVSMECGFGPCFPWTVSTDKISSFFHGVHGKLSVWSIETLFHGKFPCFPLQASFPFMDNVHG